MVIHQLMELGFQAATEETYGFLVSKVGQAAMVSCEQGYIFID